MSQAGKRERFFYGGQAVMEGVMMRGRQSYAVAVRLPTGGIQVERGQLQLPIYVHPLWRRPFLRGLAVLVEQLHLGIRSMIWSTAMHAGDRDIQIGRGEIALALGAGLAVSGLVFIVLPLLGAGWLLRGSSSIWFVGVEGLIRAGLVLGYLGLAGLMKDVRRVFQYHGAEHKTVNAVERGWPLEPAVVQRASTLHPRCGTGFLLVVLVFSILIFSLVAATSPNWIWLIVSRLLGIPVIASLSFEWIRFLTAMQDRSWARLLLLPVLWMQKLTTRQPDDGMVEVAIAALQAVRENDPARVASS
jgi:uncharacterized protein YqhQ